MVKSSDGAVDSESLNALNGEPATWPSLLAMRTT